MSPAEPRAGLFICGFPRGPESEGSSEVLIKLPTLVSINRISTIITGNKNISGGHKI